MSTCSKHNRPGRCVFGTLVVCDWCDEGRPSVTDADWLADEIQRSVFKALDEAKPQTYSESCAADAKRIAVGHGRCITEPVFGFDDETTDPGDIDAGGILWPMSKIIGVTLEHSATRMRTHWNGMGPEVCGPVHRQVAAVTFHMQGSTIVSRLPYPTDIKILPNGTIAAYYERV